MLKLKTTVYRWIRPKTKTVLVYSNNGTNKIKFKLVLTLKPNPKHKVKTSKIKKSRIHRIHPKTETRWIRPKYRNEIQVYQCNKRKLKLKMRKVGMIKLGMNKLGMNYVVVFTAVENPTKIYI